MVVDIQDKYVKKQQLELRTYNCCLKNYIKYYFIKLSTVNHIQGFGAPDKA